MGKKIPQYLPLPLKLLWWDVDVWGVIGVAFYLVISGGLVFLPAFLAPFLYVKAKKRYPRGFLKHVFYFIGFSQFKGCPSFFEDRFLE